MRFKSFLTFLLITLNLFGDNVKGLSAKKRQMSLNVLYVLERFEDELMVVLEDLYSYVYNCDEWEASRFSALGRLGNFINEHILQRNPEKMAQRLERHKRECLALIDETVLLLPGLISHKMDLKKDLPDEQCKDNVKAAVVFIGKSLSWACGYKCPVFKSMKKQLAQYRVCLESLEKDFIRNRLMEHGPTFMQLYGEKFVVGIFAAAIVSGGLALSTELRGRIFSAFKSANYLFWEGIKSFKIWSGWEEYEGDTLVDKIDRTVLDSMDTGLSFVKEIKSDAKFRKKVKPIMKELVELAKDSPDPTVGSNLSRAERGEIRLQREKARAKMEGLMGTLVTELGSAVDRVPGARDKVREELSALKAELEEEMGKLFKQKGTWEKLIALPGFARKVWSPGKVWDEDLAEVRSLGNKIVAQMEERGRVDINLTNLFIAQSKLGIARIFNTVKPFAKGTYDFMLIAKAFIPVVFGSMAYGGVKKGVDTWRNKHYNAIDDAIFHIDRLLSKYTSSKTMTELDRGRLIFWVTKLRKDADSTAVSRDDRRRIALVVEEIKNTELPVNQKLRALDILWRFRKASPAIS